MNGWLYCEVGSSLNQFQLIRFLSGTRKRSSIFQWIQFLGLQSFTANWATATFVSFLTLFICSWDNKMSLSQMKHPGLFWTGFSEQNKEWSMVDRRFITHREVELCLRRWIFYFKIGLLIRLEYSELKWQSQLSDCINMCTSYWFGNENQRLVASQKVRKQSKSTQPTLQNILFIGLLNRQI